MTAASIIKCSTTNRRRRWGPWPDRSPHGGKTAIVLLTALACFFAAPVFALDHSGPIASNETWYAADNPHVVVSTVTVNAGVTLTLEDGVNVLHNSSTRINVNGTLTADGSSGGGIVFSRNGTANGAGLRFLSAGSGTLDYCTLEYATYGVLMNSNGTVTVTNSDITLCSYGIDIDDGTVELGNTTINDCSSYGFYGDGVEPTILDANVLIEDSGTGFFVRDIAGLSLTSTVTIRGNGTAGLTLDNCDNATVDNMVFVDNVGTHGAVYMVDVGEFTLGGGNVIGGSGDENSWPLAITAGSYPSASSVIPASGNTNNAIRVHGGTSDRTGMWRKFTGLDYVVTSTVTIAAGGDLTIADEVTVLHNSSTRINVNGTLTAIGSPDGGILFSRSGAANGAGLRFLSAGSGTLDYCTLQYATYGVLMNSSGTVTVTNSDIAHCGYGISMNDGTVELGNTTISDCSSYGYYGDGVEPTILDANVLIEDSGTGFFVRDIAGPSLTSTVTIRGNSTAGLTLDNCENATVDNMVFVDNVGTHGAIYMVDVGEFALGGGNVIGGNGAENSWPLAITAGSYPSASSVIPASGNTNNAIRVHGGTSDRTGMWRKFTGLDYVVSSSPTISAGGGLTIADEVTVLHNSSTRINVNGTLTAIGSPAGGILFSRSGAANGAGLRFLSAGNGTLDYCTLQYATYGVLMNSSGTVTVTNSDIAHCGYGVDIDDGTVELGSTTISDCSSYGLYGDGVEPTILDANVLIEDSGTGYFVRDIAGLSLTSAVTIRDNGTAGLTLDNCDDATVNNMIFADNAGTHGAIYMVDVGEFTLGGGNAIGGTGLENSWPLTITAGSYPSASSVIPASSNTNNAIRVHGGTSDRTGTWRKFTGLDYVVSSSPTISAGGGLTIADEVSVLHNSSTRISVAGTLTAIGSPDGGILFNRYGTANGAGLRFTGNGSGTLDYCTLQYATYGVLMNSTGTISVSNTIIRQCSHGVNATDGEVHFLNDQILSNSSYGVYLNGATPYFGDNEDEWNDIYNNGGANAGRNLRNGPTDIDAFYVYWGTNLEPEIQFGIWDENDDLDLGLVNYTPWSTEPHGSVVAVPEEEEELPEDELSEEELPRQFVLDQNYPNPFNPATTIRFSLASAAPVRLTVFDLTGALVATLVDHALPAGNHSVTWRGLDRYDREVASGVYLYTITAGDFQQTRRLMLIR